MTDHKEIATPTRTQAILNTYGLEAKKSLGQNFVIDSNILKKMVQVAGVNENTQVIEVGPGIGALTEQIAMEAKKVVAFEIDQRFINVLAETLSRYDNVEIVHQDILSLDLENQLPNYIDFDQEISVVANLPYYITTPIIMNFIEADLPIKSYALMMQKEVAQRMTAAPSTKAYGSLTIAIDYYCEASIAFDVPPTVFIPRPNVGSAILLLETRPEPKVEVVDEEAFFALLRHSFQQRRKTLWNNLTKAYGKDEDTKSWLEKALEEANIDPQRRAESMTIEEFAALANAMATR